MPKKKRRVEDDWPDPTPERQLTSRSGWCADGFHSDCRYRFSFGKCGCSCHKKDV